MTIEEKKSFFEKIYVFVVDVDQAHFELLPEPYELQYLVFLDSRHRYCSEKCNFTPVIYVEGQKFL